VALAAIVKLGLVMPAALYDRIPRVTRFENESPRDLCNPPQCSLYLFIESRRLNRTYVNFTSYHSGYCSRLNGIHPCKLNCTPNICQSIDQPVQQFGPGDKSGNDNRIDRCNPVGNPGRCSVVFFQRHYRYNLFVHFETTLLILVSGVRARRVSGTVFQMMRNWVACHNRVPSDRDYRTEVEKADRGSKYKKSLLIATMMIVIAVLLAIAEKLGRAAADERPGNQGCDGSWLCTGTVADGQVQAGQFNDYGWPFCGETRETAARFVSIVDACHSCSGLLELREAVKTLPGDIICRWWLQQ